VKFIVLGNFSILEIRRLTITVCDPKSKNGCSLNAGLKPIQESVIYENISKLDYYPGILFVFYGWCGLGGIGGSEKQYL